MTVVRARGAERVVSKSKFEPRLILWNLSYGGLHSWLRRQLFDSTGDCSIKGRFSRRYRNESRLQRNIYLTGIRCNHGFSSHNSIITDGNGRFLDDFEIGNSGSFPYNFSLTTHHVNMEVSFCIIDGIGSSIIKIDGTYLLMVDSISASTLIEGAASPQTLIAVSASHVKVVS